MEIKIGVKQTQREITFETDEDPKDLAARIEEKVQSEGLLTFSDTKGRQIFVPAGSLGYRRRNDPSRRVQRLSCASPHPTRR